MRDHTKLRAFILADELTLTIYRITIKFPKEETFGLTSQMRRSVVSVPSNIVEGSTRESQTEYLLFLEIAFSSLRELHYQFGLAKRLGYIQETEVNKVEKLLTETGKVLGALMRSLRKSYPSKILTAFTLTA